MKPSVLLQLFH